MFVLKGDGLLNLFILGTNPWILGVPVGVEFGEGLKAFVSSAMIDKPSRAFWEQHDQSAKSNCWEELQSEWDPPLTAVVVCNVNVSAVRDPSGDQSTDSEHELLQGSNATSDGWMCQLGLVQRDDHYQDSYSHQSQGFREETDRNSPTPSPAKNLPLHRK